MQVVLGRSGLTHFLEHHEGLPAHLLAALAHDLDHLSEGLEEVEEGVLDV